MRYINDKLWIDLDPYIDTEGLFQHFDKICWAIGKNHRHIAPATHGADCLYNPKYIDLGKTMADADLHASQELIELTQDMTSREKRFFYLYYFDTVSMNYNLILRGNRDTEVSFLHKHLSEYTRYYEPARDFGFFWRWLKKESIFKDVGRVNFFLSEAKDKVGSELSNHIHRDYANGKTYKDQFIWINFSPAKKFFIYNPDTKEKNYITSRISVFDNSNWHGVEEPNHACFSLRIDGLFSDKFLEKTGLGEHFKP